MQTHQGKSRRTAMITLATMASILPLQLPAAAKDQATENTILSLEYENDFFAGQDLGFTNGFSITVIPGRQQPPRWLLGTGELLSPLSTPGRDLRWSWGIEQLMFTPDDIEDPLFPPDDRPYAGWLNASMSLFSIGPSTLERFRLSLGIVGPSSLAEEVQKEAHRLSDSHQPVGWETQLPDEPTLQLAYDRQWRIETHVADNGVVTEFGPGAGITVGNAFTGVEAGGFLRVGRNLPVDFGPQRLRSMSGGSGFFEPTAGFGWFVFTGVTARYTPHNIFLDGSLFQDSPSVSRAPWLGQGWLGFACYHGATRIGYTHVVETRAFDNQPERGQFGALSISWAL